MRTKIYTEPTDLPNIDHLLERSDVSTDSVPHMRIGGDMMNRYLLTLILSALAGGVGLLLLHVLWPLIRLLPVVGQYAVTGVGGIALAIYLADRAREVFPPPFESGSEGRAEAPLRVGHESVGPTRGGVR